MVDIRHALPQDAPAIIDVERTCFPASEAASAQSVNNRIATHPNQYWLLFDRNRLAGFVSGMSSNETDLRDDMYTDASLYADDGEWLMILGVDVMPAYRHRGCASRILKRVIGDAHRQGRRGLVLTCKEPLIGFYERFGFRNEGVSQSTHGNVTWHQMRLTFQTRQESLEGANQRCGASSW